MSLKIKNVKARIFSVKKDGKLIGRIASDGSYGCEPVPHVVWLTPGELDEINYEARRIARESAHLNVDRLREIPTPGSG